MGRRPVVNYYGKHALLERCRSATRTALRFKDFIMFAFADSKMMRLNVGSIRSLRKERGWTQTELAERVEVSKNTISSIEKGEFLPSLSLICRLMLVFDLTFEDLFEVSVHGGL